MERNISNKDIFGILTNNHILVLHISTRYSNIKDNTVYRFGVETVSKLNINAKK